MITTVIIPVLNGYDKLERCLASLADTVTNVLVIDNGDGLDPALARNVRVLQMPSNLGVPQSWNLGIKLYPHEPGWLLLNHDAWFSDPEAWHAFEADCATDRITLAGAPPWCCAWIGRDVVDRVGLFCELFYPAYMEDVDYEQRAKILHIDVVTSRAKVEHQNSSTIRTDTTLRRFNDATHARNLAIFRERWQYLTQLGVPQESEWSLRVRRENAWDA
jgi:GT2 family glycosyltransferase